VSFYDYDSASAHTGFELPNVASAFLYVDPSDNDLALFFLAGRDGDLGLPPAQPESDVEVFFRGLPLATSIAISDDSGEVTRLSGTDARARWSFNDNSDGAVFTRLSWSESWRVVIEGTYRAGISSVRYVDGDGRGRPMVLRDAVVIEHRAGRSQCRTDCRIPRCGDGFVDGGERCDDGNTRSGDGCAADCQRFE
jgi:cysteine-rich repeat protein